MRNIIIIGGGAAGFFAALNIASNNPEYRVTILEKNKHLLHKVKISGGGRCNVTNGEFEAKRLSKNYPRGERELLGPFHHFNTSDTVKWFEGRGVELKQEKDGRIFPKTDNSQTIIDCFLQEAEKLKIEIILNTGIDDIEEISEGFLLKGKEKEFICDKLVITTGSNKQMWQLLAKLGHNIIPPVPSLFTFKTANKEIVNLAGIATDCDLEILETKLKSTGPLLITHQGFSGPSILKLSAWGARILAEKKYQFCLKVNFLPNLKKEEIFTNLLLLKKEKAKQMVKNNNIFNLPKRLFLYFLHFLEIEGKLADISDKKLKKLSEEISGGIYEIIGKSTFKDEFVTAGGVDLKQIDFKTYQSKKIKDLYFSGEVLNIDAITGGFNFQNAWTGGFVLGENIEND